ncbi:MAG: acyl carrier protein [Angustibacter sp.]
MTSTEHEKTPRDERARAAITELLARISPGNDLAAIPPDADLRAELDLDSMDFLGFVVGLDDKVGVAVPEEDYPQLTTMRGAVDYVASRLPQP